jgi:hypothetical protein
MTATAGFLSEPQPGYIAHTTLSAPFATNLSYLDAIMFLAEIAAPTSLKMATVAQRKESLNPSGWSAYNIASGTEQSFESACATQTKLHRQWSAYRRCAGDAHNGITELLSRLNWRSLGSTCVVDVSMITI